MPGLPTAAHAEVLRGLEVAGRALDDLRATLLRETGGAATEAGVEAKSDGTPVTELDHAADELLTARFHDAFPAHGVLSEEGGTTVPDTTWTWIVDPIDGTSNFTAGLPYWCTAVALAHEGEPVLGIVDAPVLGRRYVGIVGEGAHLYRRTASLTGGADNAVRTPMQVRSAVDWRRSGSGHIPVMLTTGTARRVRDVGLQLNPRVMGSTALDLAMVADGVAAASVAVIPKVWDVAAGIVLVREAGGVVTGFGERPLFPLVPGEEHRARSTPWIAGPDDGYVASLAEAFLGAR